MKCTFLRRFVALAAFAVSSAAFAQSQCVYPWSYLFDRPPLTNITSVYAGQQLQPSGNTARFVYYVTQQGQVGRYDVDRDINDDATPGVVGLTTRCVAQLGNTLYLAGTSTQNGGNSANLWSLSGTGWVFPSDRTPTGGSIRLARQFGSNLYIAGSFSELGDQPFRDIARFNGSTWTRLDPPGDINSGSVLDIEEVNGQIFMSMSAYRINGVDQGPQVFRLIGTTWVSTGFTFANASSLQAFQGALYAGTFNGLYRYNNSVWTFLGSGSISEISPQPDNSLLLHGGFGNSDTIRFRANPDTFTAGPQVGGFGSFTSATFEGRTFVGRDSGMYTLDGTRFVPAFTRSPSWRVNALLRDNDRIVVAGDFNAFAGRSCDMIASVPLNSTAAQGPLARPSSQDSGSQFGYALATTPAGIYLGGIFSSVDGVPASHIALLDRVTNTWRALGTGLSAPALAITPFQSGVVVGGQFLSAGGAPANRVAYWDEPTQTWSPLGNGVGSPGAPSLAVSSLHVREGTLYAGGNFPLARWTGTTWEPAGPSNVATMVTFQGKLIIGGSFATVNEFNQRLGGVAILENGVWRPLGRGLGNSVFALTTAFSCSDVLVAGGVFQRTGWVFESPTPEDVNLPGGVAVWDGQQWLPVSNAPDVFSRADVRALATSGYNILAGGDFNGYLAWLEVEPTCDSIDFNNDDIFPDDQDVADFFSVLAGDTPSTCNPVRGCNDIDFNNDAVFPDENDIISFFNVLAGGACR